jgi:long-chain acyl-CoA synthetase
MLMRHLYRQAEQRPDHTAVVYGGERVSFADLVEQVERLAQGLAEQGIEPGDAVALVLRDDPWFVTSFHAETAESWVMVQDPNPFQLKRQRYRDLI